MNTKEFAITLDMKRSLPFHPFEVVEGDTGNVLFVTLENDGVPVALDGCDVCVVFASSAGFAMQDLTTGIALLADTGRFSVTLYPGSYGAGDVRADVQVYSGPLRETLITSSRFTFRCRTALMSTELIRSETAYPPLVEATRDARAAAAEARAAIVALGDALGEDNVQSDWAEQDAESDAFIKNKPVITNVPGAHAGSHAVAGSDPVTPASIGAEARRLQFSSVAAPVSAFVADDSYVDYPFKADLPLTGVVAGMTAEVVFDAPDARTGNFAPVALCGPGYVRIYAREAPEAALTVPTVICMREVDGSAGDGGEGVFSATVTRLWTGSLASYEALVPQDNTLYFIKG